VEARRDSERREPKLTTRSLSPFHV
jgi:hypothetical protein